MCNSNSIPESKLQTILSIQKKNNHILKSYLEQIPEFTFRTIPDAEGDSCTFLSWFLPSESLMRATVAELKEQGIYAGNFYWFSNNWHYIRKWQHLKYAHTLNNISEEQKTALYKLQTQDFSASDAIIGRCISTSIALSWTEEQVHDKGAKLAAAIKKAIANASVEA